MRLTRVIYRHVAHILRYMWRNVRIHARITSPWTITTTTVVRVIAAIRTLYRKWLNNKFMFSWNSRETLIENVTANETSAFKLWELTILQSNDSNRLFISIDFQLMRCNSTFFESWLRNILQCAFRMWQFLSLSFILQKECLYWRKRV